MDDTRLSLAMWLAREEEDVQKNIVLARRYFDGDHDVTLSERQKEYLGFAGGGRFALNYCRVVVNAVTERLLVDGFESVDTAFSKLAWDVWQRNRMDAQQATLHEMVVRDGEAFVLVDWDPGKNLPRLTLHPRYTGPQVDGTGYGCKAHYPDDDDTQPMTYASKRWSETVEDADGGRRTVQRMTLYFPERVEKYELMTDGSEAGWALLQTIPWVDKDGQPLGIPMVHFRNPGSRSEIWDAIPIQDAINKAALDALAVADTNGFRIIIAKGFYPTTDGKPPEADGSNYLKLSPGCWMGVPKVEADAKPLEPADLSGALELIDSLIMKLAQVTDTPTGRFQITRQVAGEATLKQQDAPLLAKIRRKHAVFGNAWEDVMYLARRLDAMYGSGGLNDEALLSVCWEPAEQRVESEVVAQLAVKREKLSIPLEQIWKEAGYDDETIAKMMQSPEYQARMTALAQMQNTEPAGTQDADDGEAGGEAAA